MLFFIAVFIFGFILLILRGLNIASSSAAPILYFKNSPFNISLLQNCPILSERYIPPFFWGRNGHLQTIIYARIGRKLIHTAQGDRVFCVLPDGATMSYDVYTPDISHSSRGYGKRIHCYILNWDFTLVVCPGIANSSESLYIKAVVNHATSQGFRVAVLNHIGALKNECLTSPRTFTLGSTEEFSVMIERLKKSYPQTRLIGAGFSLGANILLKYLGESKSNQQNIVAAMSFCQGYEGKRCLGLLLSWSHCRRIYMYALAKFQLSILNRHRDVLFAESKLEDQEIEDLFKCTTFQDIDSIYTSKKAGFSSYEEYYEWASCCNYLHNIDIPLLLVNSADDPIVPQQTFTHPKSLALCRDNVIFAIPKHGGHLGFFEGGLLMPDTLTWLDRAVVQYANAFIKVCQSGTK